jgi:hypothetical protein
MWTIWIEAFRTAFRISGLRARNAEGDLRYSAQLGYLIDKGRIFASNSYRLVYRFDCSRLPVLKEAALQGQ